MQFTFPAPTPFQTQCQNSCTRERVSKNHVYLWQIHKLWRRETFKPITLQLLQNLNAMKMLQNSLRDIGSFRSEYTKPSPITST